MEKPSTKQVYKMLRVALPRAAPITFQVTPPRTPPSLSPPHSPRKASPPVSLVPKEARRKSKNENLDAVEPTSPKVSCLGQIKGLKRIANKPTPSPESNFSSKEERRKPNLLSLLKVFKGKEVVEKVGAPEDTPSPSFGDIKLYGSERGVWPEFVCDEEMVASACVDNPLYEEKEGEVNINVKAEITKE